MYLVPSQSAVAGGAVVGAQQQQLPADRAADRAALLRRQRADVPAQFLRQEQALDREAARVRARRLRVPGRREAQWVAGAAAAGPAAAARRSQQTGLGGHSGRAGATKTSRQRTRPNRRPEPLPQGEAAQNN